jgi:hypothetical protein
MVRNISASANFNLTPSQEADVIQGEGGSGDLEFQKDSYSGERWNGESLKSHLETHGKDWGSVCIST